MEQQPVEVQQPQNANSGVGLVAKLTMKTLAQTYRYFSDRHYQKWKHQYPRMRESEVVSKIIKTWESLSSQEKAYYYRENLNYIEFEQSEKSSVGSDDGIQKRRQNEEIRRKREERARQLGVPVPEKQQVRVFKRDSDGEPEGYDSDFSRSDARPKIIELSGDEEEIGRPSPLMAKNKQILKKKQKALRRTKKTKTYKKKIQENKNYEQFHRFHYQNLKPKHKWTDNQLMIIIKLLWKLKQKGGVIPTYQVDDPFEALRNMGRKIRCYSCEREFLGSDRFLRHVWAKHPEAYPTAVAYDLRFQCQTKTFYETHCSEQYGVPQKWVFFSRPQAMRHLEMYQGWPRQIVRKVSYANKSVRITHTEEEMTLMQRKEWSKWNWSEFEEHWEAIEEAQLQKLEDRKGPNSESSSDGEKSEEWQQFDSNDVQEISEEE